MSITKYKTRGIGNPIQQVEVIRETAAFVYVTGYKGVERREAKETNWDRYHDSWSDARDYLLKQAELSVKNARRELEAANGKLGNIKGMKPPKDAK